MQQNQNTQSDIVGYTVGDFRLPLFAPAPKSTVPEKPYRGKTAEELDEECTRVHEANELNRRYGF